MIVSIKTFDSYSGNFEDNESALLLKAAFLKSAEEIVIGYLGYDPQEKEYNDILLSSNGEIILYLNARPISKLAAIQINGVSVATDLFIIKDDYIRFKDYNRRFSKGIDNIAINYTAGWKEYELPSVIKISILRIATLMLSETNGNIGLTGKSFADNSRTFINYSNYRKYLEPLDSLRIVRF